MARGLQSGPIVRGACSTFRTYPILQLRQARRVANGEQAMSCFRHVPPALPLPVLRPQAWQLPRGKLCQLQGLGVGQPPVCG